MKSLKLSTKISILAGAAIIVASAAVGVVASEITGSEVTKITLENLETTELGVMDTLDNWRSQLEYSTLVLADKTRLASALAINDFNTANSLTVEQKKVLDIDYLLVTDEGGRVVGGNAKIGSSLANSHAVKTALRGEKEYSYESTDIYNYSLVYAYPIKSEGKVVGTVVGTFSMVDPEFVNSIKNTYKVECTMFEGNSRASTTLGALAQISSEQNSTIKKLFQKFCKEASDTKVKTKSTAKVILRFMRQSAMKAARFRVCFSSQRQRMSSQTLCGRLSRLSFRLSLVS